MRDIEFRGWDGHAMYPAESLTMSPMDREWLCKTDFELMQYTGLKDKNGVKIFEGDIIQVPDSDDYLEPGDAYEVYFAYGGFRMKPKRNPKSRGYWLEDDGEFLVLGNIHQNPELVGAQ